MAEVGVGVDSDEHVSAPVDLMKPPPGVTLESVLATDELYAAPPRQPDYAAENSALLDLARHLASEPRSILQRLVDVTLTTFKSGSAGISLVSKETGDFYWPAVAGAFDYLVGSGTPRWFGPCGVVLDRSAGQLFRKPEIYYPYLLPVAPIYEVLLAPFSVDGEVVGTVWVVAHDEHRKFDAEDLRVLESLATFTACAFQTLETLDTVERAQRRQAYMLGLSDVLRPLRDPVAIQSAACDFLGSALKASRAFYAEAEGESAVVRSCFAEGVEPVLGRLHATDYGVRGVTELREGRTNRSSDIENDPAIDHAERTALRAIHVGAYIGVPLVKDGDWVSVLCVHSIEPRKWTPDEISLVEETAERTWAATERAKAEEVSRDSAARLQTSEEEIRQLNAELEIEVVRRTAQLLETNEQLQGFTYSVAHDLRQQIRGISVNASILLTDAPDRLTEEDKVSLNRMAKSATNLGKLVDELLNHARLGKHAPQRRPIDVTALTEEVAAELVDGMAGASKPRFNVQQSLTAYGDPTMVKIVLVNLLENACKFSQAESSPVIEVGSADGSFYVRDNGIGFETQYEQRLFLPFERLHRADEYPGTGIGLANVKRIIEKHGGKVWAKAEPGNGATFYFTLPEPAHSLR